MQPKRSITVVLAWLAALMMPALGLTGCKDVPGADGRYANHDHGNYRPP
jgi:hypothetical protein